MASSRKNDSTSEEGIAAASYTLAFYKQVMSVTEYKAHYRNLLAELHAAGLGDTEIALEDLQKNQLKEIVQSIRYHIDMAITQYVAIVNDLNLNEAEEKRLKELKQYNIKFSEDYVLKLQDVDAVTAHLHTFLLKKVVKGLLKSSQDIITQIYGGNSNDT